MGICHRGWHSFSTQLLNLPVAGGEGSTGMFGVGLVGDSRNSGDEDEDGGDGYGLQPSACHCLF